jgi:hypothetical protein
LVNHVGALLKQEIESHEACGKPSTRYEDIRFQFNVSRQSTTPFRAALEPRLRAH